MSIIKAIFSLKGELKRSTFVISSLIVLLIFCILVCIPTLCITITQDVSFESNVAKLLTASIYVMAILFGVYASVCLGIKRLRDMGASTGFVILLLIPYINLLAILFFAVYPSKIAPLSNTSEEVIRNDEKKNPIIRHICIIFTILFFISYSSLVKSPNLIPGDALVQALAGACVWSGLYAVCAMWSSSSSEPCKLTISLLY